MFKRNANKYNAKRTFHDGYFFDSKGESHCYNMLKLLEMAGECEILQHQVQVHLVAGISYRADFKIWDKRISETVYIEYKGLETEVWKLKKKLWRQFGPNRLRIYKGYGTRVTMMEEIIPKEASD